MAICVVLLSIALWNVGNNKGLKDVLTSNINLNSVVFQPMPKLTLLTSGLVDSNPLALLDSPAMSDLVGRSRREYDLILIDAPPLPVTADVLTLSKLVDGIVFVTRPGVVELDSAQLAQETLENTGQKVLGMIINGVKPSDFDRYSYHGRYAKSYYTTSNHDKNQSGRQQGDHEFSKVTQENNANGSVSRANL